MNDFKHKKKFGQNFLKDKNIIRKIVKTADFEENDKVWEVGPGKGVLTEELLLQKANLTCFEIDKALWDFLEDKFGNTIKLVKGDVLKVNWEELLEDNIYIVANLPYQITSPFLFRVAKYSKHFKKVVIMIQHEVAARIQASTGTKTYGALSIKMQHYFNVKYEFKVPPHLFFPPPKVTSAVISLTPRIDKPQIENEDLYWKIINACFANRRKMLRKNLLAILEKEQVVQLQNYIDFSLELRGEALAEKDFIKLYNAISAILQP